MESKKEKFFRKLFDSELSIQIETIYPARRLRLPSGRWISRSGKYRWFILRGEIQKEVVAVGKCYNKKHAESVAYAIFKEIQKES